MTDQKDDLTKELMDTAKACLAPYMTDQKHTALPWKVLDNGRTCAIEADEIEDNYVAQELTREDAELACRSVNNHYGLLDTLRLAADWFDQDSSTPWPDKKTAEGAWDLSKVIQAAIEKAERGQS